MILHKQSYLRGVTDCLNESKDREILSAENMWDVVRSTVNSAFVEDDGDSMLFIDIYETIWRIRVTAHRDMPLIIEKVMMK